jgi:sulfur dioxygenase
MPERSNAHHVDQPIREGEPIAVGDLSIEPLHTPGHTDDHHCYLVDGVDGPRIFSGDVLLIDGCGRSDFQQGDAAALYRSVHDKIFTLPDETLVYPGHDYQQRRVSSVAQERARNARLGAGKSLDEFVAIMAALDLPRPKKMDIAVPANRECGVPQNA